jgi:hypothetical protein
MQIKQGANIAGIRIPLREALMVADNIWTTHGQELVVTSGLDGTHSPGSLHYYGYAIDLRTRYFSEEEKRKVFEKLKIRLKEPFRVIYHKTHIHIEWRGLIQ